MHAGHEATYWENEIPLIDPPDARPWVSSLSSHSQATTGCLWKRWLPVAATRAYLSVCQRYPIRSQRSQSRGAVA